MQFKKLLLYIMLLSACTFANLNTGLQKGQKILFVRLDKYASMTNFQGVNWIANKLNVHHTVVQKNHIPANLSEYDQVWDVRFDFHQRYLTNAEIGYLQNFMKNDSGSVFLLGENNQFTEVNNPLKTFVNSVTKKGGFAASGIGYIGNSGSGWNNTITIDAAACDSAENFDTDHQTGWAKVWTEVPGMVKKSEMAGGFSVLQYGANWAGAVAWTRDKLKAEYPGKLFVFFDSQALHCNANTQWGLAWNHKNNLKFFWNISDFLSRTVPQATLTADPGTPDEVTEYNTGILEVTLTSGNVDDSISYTVFHEDGTIDMGIFIGTGIVTITGDDTIIATAYGDNVDPQKVTWYYDRELPMLDIMANPEDEVFEGSLDITFYAEGLGKPVMAEIKYIIDSTGTGYDASMVKTEGVLFDPSKAVTIKKSVTIYVSAVDNGGNFTEGFESFTYELELLVPNITVTPSDSEQFYFGNTLDTIKLSTDADSLKWILSEMAMDLQTVSLKGDSSSVITEAINSSDADTMYLSVYAFGNGYKPRIETYVYVRQYLPPLTDNENWGSKFYGVENINLVLTDSSGEYDNLKIYYLITEDSSAVVDTLDDIQKIVGVEISETSYIKAIATADNAVTSPVFKGYYIFVAGSEAAWYKDMDGNGLIDAVTVNLTKDIGVLPDSVILINPFDANDEKIIYKEGMEIDGAQLSIHLEDEFTSSKEISTYFETRDFGYLYGSHYLDSSFEIGDSVAPVIVEALCIPGEIFKTNGKIEQGPYKLSVTFSENVTRESLEGDKQLFNFMNFSEGFGYYFDLTLESFNGDNSTFIVDDRFGNYPLDGDSIRINANDEIAAIEGNVVQNEEENRYCYLQVLPIEVVEELMVLSPVNPKKQVIDPSLGSSFSFGLPVIIDYLIPLSESVRGTLDAKVKIFDQVGNIVAYSNGRFEGGDNIDVSLSKNGKTLLSIVWNGSNSKGRFASAGVYKMVITYLASDGKSWKSCMKSIGVRN